ncbi:flavin reductase family protein [Ornithinibacillus halophilus]|uniref:NADH-FMN oxidoreductase RutF, flavin reductase (DIM6/NTAB) family n=1 Tax=Ornithinibacillus halophilus TaxID=930117 RepID=A0A1M5FJV5_9BACI|nr:flavin reductase family protein [Ornithinibacillus halophilus]SHF91800.1 NADH-FMN oxidoreductase RutF, flavin reductase (DIM6/NTAB) family [Ornithinibacillus halophilus]
MRKPTDKTVMHSYPGMVALVTVNYNGETNIMAAGWHSYISHDPAIYGVAIGRERYTYELVKNAGEFAINFLPYEKAAFIQQSGVYSGEKKDKLTISNLTYDQGITVNAPILHEAYVAYECKTIDVNTYGDHDWFVGKITQCYRDDAMFLEDGLPNFEKLQIPLYLGRSKYAKMDSTCEVKSYEVDK